MYIAVVETNQKQVTSEVTLLNFLEVKMYMWKFIL